VPLFCFSPPPIPFVDPAAMARSQGVLAHLSSEGTFLLGDAQAQGFPIRYASPGFEQTYGYRAADIVGKKCGDVIGGSMIKTKSLAQLAKTVGLTLREADASIRFLTAKAAEACRVMMANPGTCVGVAILVNRKKNGVLFVCECLVLNLRHPTLNWSYCVGFQRDISKQVPLERLLSAAISDSAYSALIESRGSALDARRQSLLGVGSENVVRCLHEKALDVFSLDIWRTLRSDMLLAASSGHSSSGPSPTTSASSSVVMLHRHKRPNAMTSADCRALATASAAAMRTTTSASIVPKSHPHDAVRQSTRTDLSMVVAEPSPHGVPMDLEACEEMISFLSVMGLHSFAETLLRSGFDDMDTLVDLTEGDMKDLGLPRGSSVKLRNKLHAYRGNLQLCDSFSGNSSDTRAPGSAPEAHDKTAVQDSWERIQQMGVDRFGEALFGELFRLEPMTQQFFTAQVCEKYWDWVAAPSAKGGTAAGELPVAPQLFAKVVNVIGGAIVGLHDAQSLVPSLVQIGARHASYGVRPEHMMLLGQALPVALREVLGGTFTKEVELAWSIVYNFISASMIGGMQAATCLARQATPVSSMATRSAASSETHFDRAQSDEASPTLLKSLRKDALRICTDKECR